MSGEDKAKVIAVLNQARTMELQAISQYMIQHYLLDGMDYGKLCAYAKLIAVDEMRHCEKFAERVDALGGKPACEMAGPVVQGQAVDEIFKYDVNLEDHTIIAYNNFVKTCQECNDHISAALFQSIIHDENVHLGYYEETVEHLKELGNVFLAKFAGTSKHTGPIKSFVKVMEKEEF